MKKLISLFWVVFKLIVQHLKFNQMKNNRLFIILTSITLILLIPFISSQIYEEVNWSTLDFFVAGILLYSAGIVLEVIIRNIKKSNKRLISIMILIIILILIWVELAVGIFRYSIITN